jgi:TPR repeat protein
MPKMQPSEFDRAVAQINAGNYEQARKLLEELESNEEAQLQLAYLYQTGQGGPKDIEKAQEIYQLLSNSGSANAIYYLASIFLEKRQLRKALDCFERSANFNHVSGAYWAAALHGGLHGNPRNEQKHLFFLNKAASLGHIFALRDQAIVEMQNARNISDWCGAFLRYSATKIKGVFIVLRNTHDLRVR